MKKKIIIISSILLVITIFVAIIIINYLPKNKDNSKESNSLETLQETKNNNSSLEVMLLSQTENTITVEDKNNIIYTFSYQIQKAQSMLVTTLD